MTDQRDFRKKLLWLTVYAVAMAYLEATVVVYLRELYYPEKMLKIFPPEFLSDFDLLVELGREAATIIMMLSVAFLAERKNATRIFAAFVYQFGIWDIFYYIWLKITIGWPVQIAEWDILFLIPWAWLGPWICPVFISLLFVGWGGAVLLSGENIRLTKSGWLIFSGGAVLALISFLQPALSLILTGGREALSQYQPDGFWWWFFISGYLVMAYGLFKDFRKKAGD
ncbi:MAG: hypothetical protein Kow0042_27070 [Calditrichia bacterium]